jgi:hypothetical protein
MLYHAHSFCFRVLLTRLYDLLRVNWLYSPGFLSGVASNRRDHHFANVMSPSEGVTLLAFLIPSKSSGLCHVSVV